MLYCMTQQAVTSIHSQEFLLKLTEPAYGSKLPCAGGGCRIPRVCTFIAYAHVWLSRYFGTLCHIVTKNSVVHFSLRQHH